ncbi:very short patch repair endonuclease [Nocardia sp. NPDC050406]|uniref:very short patch repair endonuclease n=1 Tax=Nocardia sp. NPDC050406 TaxID=3364318 RepID=UPI0037A7C230
MTRQTDSPPDRAARFPVGRGRTASVAEQDRAAGGREQRLVDLGDGRFVRASIVLKRQSTTGRVRAYLRWADKRKTTTRLVGEVDGATRRRDLEQGWRLAHERHLIPRTTAPRTSWASTPAVRSVMRANRNKDTRPELALRAAIRAHRLGYRVDTRPVRAIRRRADVVFLGPKVAVFCDGCFWHGCPEHYRPSQKNREFWDTKIEGNRRRDRETDRLLTEAGWRVVRVWEHEDPEVAADRIAEIVVARRGDPPAGR